ncbi:MAG: SusC/RagA family TonB-linked outer membrane protein [Chlorobi bacterium]|nr:SusC/RagA family TonB-linked outer membrane protein [Chlorobiota bacterium]
MKTSHDEAVVAQQQRTIKGLVTDKFGEPLPGVSVYIKGTTNGTITGVDGHYSIQVGSSDDVLVFSFIGFETQEIVVGNRTEINVTLIDEAEKLDEVVVTALGISREKKSLGYALTDISGDEVNTVKDQNVMNSLSGKVAGVVLTKSTSGPGSGTRVVIRGNNSLTGNNQPLYVVDGIPMDNSGFGSANGGGTGEYARADYGTGISDLNPDDIESISVLKGPNAAALYGSRAANGVIIITTKKGKSRKGIGVTWSSQTTFETPLVLPDFQNEYGQGSDGNYPNDYPDLATFKTNSGSWGGKLDGSQQMYWVEDPPGSGIPTTRPYVAYPDNVKDFFETGHTYVNTFAIEAGNDVANMRFSYTNNTSSGIIPNSDLKRNNFNLRGVMNASKWLTLDAKATYFSQQASNRAVQGTEGIMAYLYTIPRNADINDYKNYQAPDFSSVSHSSLGANPYWITNHDVNDDSRDRFMGYVKATFEVTNSLSFFLRAGTDWTNQSIETINQYGHWFYKTGRFNFSTYKTQESNYDFLAMYNKNFSENFSLSANFGGNMMHQTYTSNGVRGEDFKIPTKPTTSSAKQLYPSYTPLREKRINSVYGSVSLAFLNWIYLDVSARNDWSSTLPENNWSYFYPSVSLSFLLNDFIDKDKVWLDYLKVRSSYALVGNDTDPYQLDVGYNLDQIGYLGLTTLSRPATKMNPDLKPEETKSIEVGLEWRMFNNRLFGDFSYYSIKSTDLIMDVPVPASTGYSYFRSNVGEITNKGFELMLGGTPVKSSNFSWDVSFNIAHNENELVDLIEGLDNYIFTTTNSGVVVVQATVGGGYGDIYGTTYQRTDDGKMIVDSNGRPLPTSEKVYLGNYQPDFTAGLSNSFNFLNGFNLSFLIDARFGGELYSGTDASMDAAGVTERTLEYREGGVVLDAVVNTGTPDNPVYEPNTQTITAQQYWGAMAGIADYHVYSQTNVRLRELSITYDFPSKMFDNLFIEKVTLGLVGRNLFFIYKDIDNFDPESSFSTSNFSQGVLWYNLPTTKSFGFSLNINF